LIKCEQRDHPRHLAVLDQRQPAIVENDPVAVETSGNNGMVLVDGEIASGLRKTAVK